jgi:hypothetical protein
MSYDEYVRALGDVRVALDRLRPLPEGSQFLVYNELAEAFRWHTSASDFWKMHLECVAEGLTDYASDYEEHCSRDWQDAHSHVNTANELLAVERTLAEDEAARRADLQKKFAITDGWLAENNVAAIRSQPNSPEKQNRLAYASRFLPDDASARTWLQVNRDAILDGKVSLSKIPIAPSRGMGELYTVLTLAELGISEDRLREVSKGSADKSVVSSAPAGGAATSDSAATPKGSTVIAYKGADRTQQPTRSVHRKKAQRKSKPDKRQDSDVLHVRGGYVKRLD